MNRSRHFVRLAALALFLSPAVHAADEPFDRAARTEEVRQAELAFAKSVMDNRPEAFASHLDEGAVFVGAEGVTRGKAQVVEAWAGFFAEGRPYFEWHPEVVELSADGELGLSRGPWTLRAKGKDGVEVERAGTFNSVWRRQADGSWRVVFDAGCAPCPRCGG
jgi:ketosteroid isomerase-like protein